MEILFIILGIGLLAVFIFIRIKIENAKHRAKQSMLNKVGICIMKMLAYLEEKLPLQITEMNIICF